jgi:hypothetical protein
LDITSSRVFKPRDGRDALIFVSRSTTYIKFVALSLHLDVRETA